MRPANEPMDFTVSANLTNGELSETDVALAELVRARHALAYLKDKLGNETMLALLAHDLDDTAAQTEAWLADSGGRWQTQSIELIVSGPSAVDFHDWYGAMVAGGRERVMRAGHPEHFVSHPQPEFIEVVENIGETDLPWHVFYHALADDDLGFPSPWEQDFPVHFGAEILDANGVRIGFTMHQSRDAQDGMHLKLTTHLPAAAPAELAHRHLHHFAIEFTNWTRAAHRELTRPS